MSKWNKFVVKKEEVPKEEPKPEPKILTGIVYSHPHTKTIFYSEDELTFQTPYLQNLDLDIRQELPTSPLSIYKDDQRNDQLNAYWQRFAAIGLLDALAHEKSFRVAKIRLTVALPLYPLSFDVNSPGILYHDSFLDIFPSLIRDAWKPHLSDHKLVILKKLPWLLKKNNFMVEPESESPQMSLL